MRRRDVLAAIGVTGSMAVCAAIGALKRDRYGSGSSPATGWRRFEVPTDYAAVVDSSSQWNEDVAVFAFPPSPDEIGGLADRGCVRFMFIGHVIRAPLSELLAGVKPVILMAFQGVTFTNDVIDGRLDLPDLRHLWVEQCITNADDVANLIWMSHSSLRRLQIIAGSSIASILPGITRCKNLEYLELKRVGLRNSDVDALRRLPRLKSFSYGEPQSNRHAPLVKYVRQVLPGVFVDENCC